MDWILAAALVLGGFAVGLDHVNSVRGPSGQSAVRSIPELYARSVIIASGRGTYFPNYKSIPVLRAFLERETETLDPSVLPEIIPASTNDVEAYHRYLAWTVGIIWWMLGISWSHLEYLAAAFLAISALGAYGIFRLGIGRSLSTLATAAYIGSPAMVAMSYDIRDFSKTPFFLLAFWMMGWLSTREATGRRLMLVAAGLGLIVGTGLGFRQDAIILFPAGIVVLTVFARALGNNRGGVRILALAVFGAAFLASAWPMLQRAEGGAQPYHPLVQGFSTKHMDGAGVGDAFYEPLLNCHDDYVFAAAYDYYRRATHHPELRYDYNSPGDVAACRAWTLKTAATFPADVLLRGLGTVGRVIQYGTAYLPSGIRQGWWIKQTEQLYIAFANAMGSWGLWVAGAALCLMASIRIRYGLAALFLLGWFGGYLSLDYEFRHAFHLGFIPIGLVAFLFNALLFGAVHGLSQLRDHEPNRTSFAKPLRKGLGRSLCVAGIVALCAIPLLGSALYYQKRNVQEYQRLLAQAEKKTLFTHVEQQDDWVLYRPDAWGNARPFLSQAERWTAWTLSWSMGTGIAVGEVIYQVVQDLSLYPVWDTRTSYYCLTVQPRPEDRIVLLRYQTPIWWSDFSQLIRIPGTPSSQGPVSVYIPVYELQTLRGRSTFEGIGFPESQASDFIRLAKVQNYAIFPLLLKATLPANHPTPAWHVSFSPLKDPLRWYTAEPLPDMAEWAERNGRPQAALLFYSAERLMRPMPWLDKKVSELYAQQGQYETAAKILATCVKKTGEELSILPDLHALIRNALPVEKQTDIWRAMTEWHPPPDRAFYYLGLALLTKGDVEGAESALREAYRRLRNDGFVPAAFREALRRHAEQRAEAGAREEALGLFEEAIATGPEDPAPFNAADQILTKDPPARRAFWKQMAERYPDNAYIRGFLAQMASMKNE